MAAVNVFPKSDDDVLFAADANALGILNVEAGEDLTAGNAVFIKKNDGKAYRGDTDVADDIRANGIVLNTVSSTLTAYVQTGGNYVTSGLSSGIVYYLSTSGTISATRSAIEIGTATAATNLFVNIVQDDADPIGTVKFVLADITGVPTNNISAFWMLADGTTISDAESPINGQPIRDINGNNEFIRAADTSGGTGGSTSTDSTSATKTADGQGAGTNFTAGHVHTGNEPPHLDAVAIVKFK